MGKLLGNFWRDERGCVPAKEWIFVASILTLGTIAGMLALQYFEDSGEDASPAALTR
jgi:hypothetical protein